MGKMKIFCKKLIIAPAFSNAKLGFLGRNLNSAGGIDEIAKQVVRLNIEKEQWNVRGEP